MKDHQKRLVIEHRELEKKYEKLRDFLYKHDLKRPVYTDWPDSPVELLRRQLSIMDEYLCVLEERADSEGIDLNMEVGE